MLLNHLEMTIKLEAIPVDQDVFRLRFTSMFADAKQIAPLEESRSLRFARELLLSFGQFHSAKAQLLVRDAETLLADLTAILKKVQRITTSTSLFFLRSQIELGRLPKLLEEDCKELKDNLKKSRVSRISKSRSGKVLACRMLIDYWALRLTATAKFYRDVDCFITEPHTGQIFDRSKDDDRLFQRVTPLNATAGFLFCCGIDSATVAQVAKWRSEDSSWS